MINSTTNDIFKFMLIRPVQSNVPLVELEVDSTITQVFKNKQEKKLKESLNAAFRELNKKGKLATHLNELHYEIEIKQLLKMTKDYSASFASTVKEIFNTTIEKLSKEPKIKKDYQTLSNKALGAYFDHQSYTLTKEFCVALRWFYTILNYEVLQQKGGDKRLLDTAMKGVITVPQSFKEKTLKNTNPTSEKRSGVTVVSPRERIKKSSDIIKSLEKNQDVQVMSNALTEMKKVLNEGHVKANNQSAQVVNETGKKALSKPTLSLLSNKGIQLGKVSLFQAVNQLEEAQLDFRLPTKPIEKPIVPGGKTPTINKDLDNPSTYSEIQDIRVAELLVTTQTLKSYQGGEIAHIENVLKGESKGRTLTRSRRSEYNYFNEQEQTKEERHELSTTERYEVKKEVNREQSEEMKVHAETSLNIRGNPVSFSASGSFDWKKNSTEGRNVASHYAKDVVDKAVNNITNRVLSRSTSTLINEYTDENKHSYENIGGDGHVSGVYQWLNKCYEAQVFNYGWRVMLNVTIPEPASFLWHVYEHGVQKNGLENPEPPAEFDITPNQVTSSSYQELVALYKASDIRPPEPYTKVVSKTFNHKDDEWDGKNKFIFFTDGLDFEIPKGYRAMAAHISWTASRTKEEFWVDVFVGDKKFHGIRSSNGRSTKLLLGEVSIHQTSTGDIGTIPIAIQGAYVNALTVTVYIECRRTVALEREWALDAYEKLYAAYQERYREYEDKLSLLNDMPRLSEIKGENPENNKRVIKDEIKKHAIGILTKSRFDHLDAIMPGAEDRYPEIHFDEARREGRYVRFFEEAFEWDYINYKFYPYYWSRKEEWVDHFLQKNRDPHFNAFLKAGYAGLMLPIKPGYERAVMHFMETGNIWDGTDEPPMISSETYAGVLSEIEERPTGELSEPVPFGVPWTIKVPTSLVKLRPGDDIPRWVKNEETGTWEPVEALIS